MRGSDLEAAINGARRAASLEKPWGPPKRSCRSRRSRSLLLHHHQTAGAGETLPEDEVAAGGAATRHGDTVLAASPSNLIRSGGDGERQAAGVEDEEDGHIDPWSVSRMSSVAGQSDLGAKQRASCRLGNLGWKEKLGRKIVGPSVSDMGRLASGEKPRWAPP
uniref:Uncharacterized protein n=1 Tax=Oryza punctata TaxID=4537 RepID=A0A0E0JL98_ORYPU